MRVKHLWNYIPLPAKLKLVYSRLTLSHVTTAYFILALLHCILQIVWQSQALGIEHKQSAVLRSIIRAGNVTEKFAALDYADEIELCRAIPGQTADPHPCKTVKGLSQKPQAAKMGGDEYGDDDGEREGKGKGMDMHHEDRRSAFALVPRGPVFTGRVNATGQIDGVNATGLPGLPPVTLSDACTQVLAWPDQIVNQAKREALAVIAFQVWLFGISIVAILNESIPHVLAALFTHVLSTAWASFQLMRTEHFGRRFTDIVTNASCGGVDLMPSYWGTKLDNQIPILVLNAASLFVSCFLSWKLFKQYGVQSFNRVGASPRMHRIYLLVLVLSVSLQLTAFFLITSLALWIDQLCEGPIAPLAKHRTIYIGVFIATAVLIFPWLYMGWTAVRRERRRIMIFFLLTSSLLIAAQTGMFISPVYRLTFGTWTFFATLTVAAYILSVATFSMAIVCRTFFGRGLAHFLQVQDALEECDFTPVYFEKGADGDSAVEEKGPMPWDREGGDVVRRITLRRQSEECEVHDISPSQVKPPARVYFADGGTPKLRGAYQGSPAAGTPPPAESPPPPAFASPFDDRTPSPGHSRTSSDATWYQHAGGRDFIQRGVNTASPVHRGFGFSADGDAAEAAGVTRTATVGGKLGGVVGLPSSVRPVKGSPATSPRRPPGLAVVIPDGRVPASAYAPGRI